MKNLIIGFVLNLVLTLNGCVTTRVHAPIERLANGIQMMNSECCYNSRERVLISLSDSIIQFNYEQSYRDVRIPIKITSHDRHKTVYKIINRNQGFVLKNKSTVLENHKIRVNEVVGAIQREPPHRTFYGLEESNLIKTKL